MAGWTRYGRGLINCCFASDRLGVATNPPDSMGDFIREIWDAIDRGDSDSVEAIAQKYGADPGKVRCIYDAVKQRMS